ncbi:MAG: DUF3341 domain-containing protein [Armatimonadetes bacterium]|nr:DUF3341 domain-containing protein [Armatimonadota bacterium]
MAAVAMDSTSPAYHGMIAEFTDPDDILAAARKVRAAGYTHLDAYTPMPVHHLDDAIGFKDTKVQWTIFIAGLLGFAVGFGLQVYVNSIDYPLNVGGRPKLSWPQFIPVAYECTILFAGLAAALAMLAFNGLPRPNHPIFNAPRFELATQTSFFLCVEGTDPNFDHAEVKKLLESLSPVQVSDVFGDEPEGH